MKDLSPPEAGRWMSAAPMLVQNAVTSTATQQVIEQLGKQHSLHVDVIGLLLKLTSYMLLGYAKPEDSFQELRAVGIPDADAREIMAEINQKIFVPLRDEMRKGAEAAPKEAKPAMSQAAPAEPPRPDWGSHASARVPSQPTTAIPTPPAPANIKPPQVLVPAPPTSQRSALRDVLATVMKAPGEKQVSPEPHKLLEDHEEPHIEFKNTVPPVVPNITVPVVPSATPVSPKLATPKAFPPPAKPYSVDPYREPLDEK